MNFLGGIEVVANEYSKRATETVVSLGDKMRHLGTAGNEKRISQIKATATNFKRLIGLPWEHHVVQSMASGTFAAPYKLIKCNETGGAAVQLPDGNVYAIQQVMAMFLGKMKEIAEGWFQNIFVFTNLQSKSIHKQRSFLLKYAQEIENIFYEKFERCLSNDSDCSLQVMKWMPPFHKLRINFD